MRLGRDMADRNPYSVRGDMLPRYEEDALGGYFDVIGTGTGYVLAAISAAAGAFGAKSYVSGLLSGGTGAVAGPLAIVVAVAAVWLASASAAVLVGRGRITKIGAVAALVGMAASFYLLVVALFPTVRDLAAQGLPWVLFSLMTAVLLPVVATPLSVRRMRETLWQDVSWSPMDSAVTFLRLHETAWVIGHIGAPASDRYAIVGSGQGDSKSFYVLDARKGWLAATSDPETVAAAMEATGGPVTRISDPTPVVRRHVYGDGGDDGRIVFRGFPPRGITNAEYYHRYF